MCSLPEEIKTQGRGWIISDEAAYLPDLFFFSLDYQ